MNYYKQLGKNRKKEELPSFLVGLTDAPEDITFAPKPTPSTHYLGPIFVGLCTNYQHHAPPHSLKLGSFHQPQFIMLPGADDISKLLYPQTKVDKVTQTMHIQKLGVKRQKIFHDIYPHKCVGSKKMFVPDVTPHVIDLGKTRSIIEGETSFEIPLSRSHNVPLRYRRKSKRDNDFITLSDIREERRKFMSYKDRIAHAHFPKEFATIRVIGPPIPASITITKLPSKRRTESQINLELKSQKGEITEEDTAEVRRKSTKSRPVSSRTPSKKFSTKSVSRVPEDLEKVEEETETLGEVFDEVHSVREEEEIEGEGAEEKLYEVEGEKEESEEEEKEEEETAKTEEREEEKEETKAIFKEDTKTEETKTEIKEETKAEVKEETNTEVKQETKKQSKEETKKLSKEETKKQSKEETKKQSKEETKKLSKEETKKQSKEETKSLSKEETKKQSKEETKKQSKEETKKQSKEETKKLSKEERKERKKEKQIKEEEAGRVQNTGENETTEKDIEESTIGTVLHEADG